MKIKGQTPLFIRINAKLGRIAAEVETSRENLTKLNRQNEEGCMTTVIARDMSLTLHNMYNGFEQIFEDIARDVDGGTPGGLSSHSDLLDQMGGETDLRPKIIPETIAGAVADLMKFRHVFRHGYGTLLRPDEIRMKYKTTMEVVIPTLLESLQTLSDHLEQKPDQDLGSDCEPS
jgi:hypothetical protein